MRYHKNWLFADPLGAADVNDESILPPPCRAQGEICIVQYWSIWTCYSYPFLYTLQILVKPHWISRLFAILKLFLYENLGSKRFFLELRVVCFSFLCPSNLTSTMLKAKYVPEKLTLETIVINFSKCIVLFLFWVLYVSPPKVYGEQLKRDMINLMLRDHVFAVAKLCPWDIKLICKVLCDCCCNRNQRDSFQSASIDLSNNL